MSSADQEFKDDRVDDLKVEKRQIQHAVLKDISVLFGYR